MSCRSTSNWAFAIFNSDIFSPCSFAMTFLRLGTMLNCVESKLSDFENVLFRPSPLPVIHLTREVAPMTSLQKVEQRYCSHTGQILLNRTSNLNNAELV